MGGNTGDAPALTTGEETGAVPFTTAGPFKTAGPSTTAGPAARVARMTTTLYAGATAPVRLRPSFVVVGAKRCGSTSLYHWMTRHPDVVGNRLGKGSHYFDVNHGRGPRWFRSSFPFVVRRRGEIVTGEASPYYLFHPLAPARIADELPDARLLAVLRDPVARAWSHYQYSVRRGFESLPFEEALDAEPERLAGEEDRMAADPSYRSFSHRHHSYLARGLYADQLQRLFDLFPRERVLVIPSERLFREPDASMAEVFAFLGLRPVELDRLPVYKAGDYEPLPTAAAARLAACYAEPNRRLNELVGLAWEGTKAETGPR